MDGRPLNQPRLTHGLRPHDNEENSKSEHGKGLILLTAGGLQICVFIFSTSIFINTTRAIHKQLIPHGIVHYPWYTNPTPWQFVYISVVPGIHEWNGQHSCNSSRTATLTTTTPQICAALGTCLVRPLLASYSWKCLDFIDVKKLANEGETTGSWSHHFVWAAFPGIQRLVHALCEHRSLRKEAPTARRSGVKCWIDKGQGRLLHAKNGGTTMKVLKWRR